MDRVVVMYQIVQVVLVVLQPAPFNVGIREPFDIIVQVSTAHGLVVPGVEVVQSLGYVPRDLANLD